VSDTDISLDTDRAAAAAAQWREYADQVERHGRTQHVPIPELRILLGDIYADFVDAKEREYGERESAYLRVAEHARRHADKLDGTRQDFIAADDEHAARIQRIIGT
jgi:hypothetical protein